MIAALMERIEATSPIVVGLDPKLEYIPEAVRQEAYEACGMTLEGAAKALAVFNRRIVDAVADLVPAVKLQSAMYELYGLPGLTVFKETIDYCHEKGLAVIGDVKRGDIGSTSAAYAEAHLGTVQVGEACLAPFGEDFATVNPYLGSDGIRPFIEVCRREHKGIFVLVKTSNPSSGEFQDRLIDGRPLYEWVGAQVDEWGRDCMDGDYSDVGAVVGATYPEMGRVLRGQMPHTFILVPGYGAQGATGRDLKPFFDKDGRGAIVNSSRGIIAAWKQEAYAGVGAEHFEEASRLAVQAMAKDLREALEER